MLVAEMYRMLSNMTYRAYERASYAISALATALWGPVGSELSETETGPPRAGGLL